MKKILLLINIIILSSFVAANDYEDYPIRNDYPIIVSEQGVNHQKAKDLVYSIPEHHFRYVDVIEFVTTPIKIQDTEVLEFAKYKVLWNKNHYCYEAKITLWNTFSDKVIEHELGHIYEHCELKKDISTEEFANEFVIK